MKQKQSKPSPEKGVLASYLRHKRLLAGLSQGRVAKELGYSSAQFVSNWERGVSSPPCAVIPRLAELYALPKKEFILILLKEQEASLWSLFQSTQRKNHR